MISSIAVLLTPYTSTGSRGICSSKGGSWSPYTAMELYSTTFFTWHWSDGTSTFAYAMRLRPHTSRGWNWEAPSRAFAAR